MESKEAVEVLYRIQKEKQIAYDYFIRRVMPKDCIKAQNRITKEHKEAINALSEALLALEKLDRLEKWLDKEEQYFDMRIGDKDFSNALTFYNKLKEIRKVLSGGGKE